MEYIKITFPPTWSIQRCEEWLEANEIETCAMENNKGRLSFDFLYKEEPIYQGPKKK